MPALMAPPWKSARDWLPDSDIRPDWSHPLTRGLCFLVYPGRGPRERELVFGGRGTPVVEANWNWRAPHRRGLFAQSLSTTAGGVYYPRPPALTSISTAFTLAILCRIDASVDWSQLLCMPARPDTSWATPYTQIALMRNAGGTSGHLQWNGEGNTQAFTTAAGYFDTAERLYTVARAPTAGHFYKDTTLFETVSNVGALPVTWQLGETEVHLCQRNWRTQGEGLNAQILMGAIWNRTLSADEVRALYLDPFALVQTVRPIRLGAAGAATVVETLVPDTIASSTNLTGNVAAVQADDGTWLTATSPTAATSVRVTYPSLTSALEGDAVTMSGAPVMMGGAPVLLG
jgi:hypothetical protein